MAYLAKNQEKNSCQHCLCAYNQINPISNMKTILTILLLGVPLGVLWAIGCAQDKALIVLGVVGWWLKDELEIHRV